VDECKPLDRGGGDVPRGEAVRVEPIIPTLKAPATQRFETYI